MRLACVVVGVLILDQVTKVMVRVQMIPGHTIALVGDWLKFTFTENPGMAFGITFGPAGLITAFSILATVLIAIYLYSVRYGYIWYCVSLSGVFGGALGNIVDRLFYGMVFDYAPFFKGRVVDFIHVDLWTGFLPDLIPVVGGSYVSVFPIFNVADIAIVCGVAGILLFQKPFQKGLMEKERKTQDQEAEALETNSMAINASRSEMENPNPPVLPS